MRQVLIVGAGKVGFHLAGMLAASEFRVTVVDRDEAACRRVAQELDAMAICGDGTEIAVLGDAGARKADYVVAATGRDQDNLAVCRIARERYGRGKVLAVVVDPANAELYRLAGTDATVDVTTSAARMIRDAVTVEGMRLLSVFASGDLSLAELDLVAGSPAVGASVADLGLPEDSVLVALVRSGRVELVRGGTRLEVGDSVFALARREGMPRLRAAIIGSAP